MNIGNMVQRRSVRPTVHGKAKALDREAASNGKASGTGGVLEQNASKA